VMDVYLPKYENEESFIMASHVDRLKQSACFKSAEMTCVTCHNPHKSVTNLTASYFDNKCMQCHSDCKEEETKNCTSCHMPKSTSTDIQHVSITDHKIAIPSAVKNEKGNFLGLFAINNDAPTNLSKAKAYLKRFESFEQNPIYLDSAFILLNKTTIDFPTFIQYYYLKNDAKGLVDFVMSNKVDTAIYSNSSLALAYSRIAEVFALKNLAVDAKRYYNNAVSLMPFVIDYKLKLGAFLTDNKQLKAAKEIFETALALNPTHKEIHLNLGYIFILQQNFLKADLYLKQAIALDPDYVLAYENLALSAQMQNKMKNVKVYLNKILEIDPNHNARLILENL